MQHHNHDLDNVVKNIAQECLTSQCRNKDDNNDIETFNTDHVCFQWIAMDIVIITLEVEKEDLMQ